MQAIILAAGEGSRMRPLTSKLPKAMIPIAGKPLLEHIVLRTKEAGICNFILVVGYGSEYVKEHFRDGSNFGICIDYASQEKQLGTGHALLSAESFAEDRFVVLNGDALPDVESLRKMVKSEGQSVATIRIPDPTRYGVFVMEGNNLKSVVEKSILPPSDMVNTGIYQFSNDIFKALRLVPLSRRGEYELTDGLNILASKEKIRIIQLKDWIEIGRSWDILDANEKLLSEIEPEVDGEIEPGATLKGLVSIGKGSIIKAGSYIEGPVFIGGNCVIGPNCYIRPFSCLGNKVRIGNAVEIKNSSIMNGAKIGHLSYVGDSIIGENCNFGAGTITANLRHDNANIRTFVKGQLVDSGRRKLGVIMGNDVKTGINTSIYPGTVIESSFMCIPSATLKGLVRS
jgi:UDP-N-acetylglucosamine diphosphorylase/glucosamine-1-phosphate N-acetyltransferase